MELGWKVSLAHCYSSSDLKIQEWGSNHK